MKTYFNFAGLSVGLVLLLLVAFSVLKWLNMPTGTFIDWIIGALIFWWLLLIVTVPWNIHFEAKEVLAEAAESGKKEITVDLQQVKYVRQLADRSLIAAIALHLLSTLGLYGLAITGVSVVGYVGAGAALLLTLLRPAVRFYQYLAVRLSMIRREFLHPREDILELRDRVAILENSLRQIEYQLNPSYPDSWVSQQTQHLETTRKEVTQLAATCKNLEITSQSNYEQLVKDTKSAISQLTTDGKVVDHVREIIRFFKEA